MMRLLLLKLYYFIVYNRTSQLVPITMLSNAAIGFAITFNSSGIAGI